MLLLVDARVAPAFAPWLAGTFQVEAIAVRDLGFRDSEDQAIFAEGQRRGAGTVVITKDGDFFDLLQRHGPPPQIVWLSCGTTSNAFLRELFVDRWPEIRRLLETGEQFVEIR